MTGTSLWPRYAEPGDLAAIEAVPLADRGLPESTYALLRRAAAVWTDRPATTVLPAAARWREPVRRTFAELLADVHRYANLLRELGVGRRDAVALMAPNCADLIPATLAAQLAGIATPLNGGLSRAHLTELLQLSGARVLITAGPELAPEIWDTAQALAPELDAILVLTPTGAVGERAALPALDGVRTGYLADLASAMEPSTFNGIPPSASDLPRRSAQRFNRRIREVQKRKSRFPLRLYIRTPAVPSHLRIHSRPIALACQARQNGLSQSLFAVALQGRLKILAIAPRL